MIIDMYRTKAGKSCFSRIYIFSPSVHVDPAWIPVKKFCDEVLRQDDKEEKYCFDTFDSAELDKIITTHKKVTAAGKNAEMRKLFNILIVLDDVADDPRVARNERQIHELYFRGRHHKISILISTQRYRSIAPQIRTQCTALFVFRLQVPGRARRRPRGGVGNLRQEDRRGVLSARLRRSRSRSSTSGSRPRRSRTCSGSASSIGCSIVNRDVERVVDGRAGAGRGENFCT
jgi:hypothetical protein